MYKRQVFAESEVISQLASGTDIPDLVAGICQSVATRVASLAKRVGIREEVCMKLCIRDRCSHLGWATTDKILIAVPLFHCFGLTASLLASIHAGCCMHTIEYYKTLTVLKTVQEHRCTLLNGVPSMFLAIILKPGHTEYDLSSLRN